MDVNERVVERLQRAMEQLGRELAAEGLALDDGSYVVTVDKGAVVVLTAPKQGGKSSSKKYTVHAPPAEIVYHTITGGLLPLQESHPDDETPSILGTMAEGDE